MASTTICLLLVLCIASTAAFVTKPTAAFRAAVSPSHMLPPTEMIASAIQQNSMLISTIDSDIASIPTNEFATVFAGGIAVMAGGLLSTIIVGFILDSNDLYAPVVTESYAQDEEFMNELTDEERRQAEEALAKYREMKGDMEGAAALRQKVTADEAEAASKPAPVAKTTVVKNTPTDMFSDYGDN
mmetsp:Transcript_22185/g.61765  ORF Transcript_22185/g.61765 Transcript_22185/m.61765 type:complete len:186 (-) Transcript_22185:2145-2702(-)